MRPHVLLSIVMLAGCNSHVIVDQSDGTGSSPTTSHGPTSGSSSGGSTSSAGAGGDGSTATTGGSGGTSTSSAVGTGTTDTSSAGAGGDGSTGGSTGTTSTCGPIFMETFADNSAGWTLDAEWEIGPATVSSGQGWNNPDPGVDTTPTDDNGVAGVVIGGNGSTIVHPFRWLTSPDIPIDPAFGAVHVAWQRWLNTDYLPLALNRVDVWGVAQPDGALGWVSIWESGAFPGPADDAWTMQSFDVTTIAAAGVIRVRFGAAVLASGAFKTSGWNVDDVTVFAPCE